MRFAAVGVLNTAFAYAVFALLHLTVGQLVSYLVVLLLTYAVGVSEAFLVQRRFVFRSTSPWLPAYLRFWSVYLVSLALNAVLLPALVEGAEVPVLLAQPLVLLLLAVGSYLAHRSYSFRPQASSS